MMKESCALFHYHSPNAVLPYVINPSLPSKHTQSGSKYCLFVLKALESFITNQVTLDRITQIHFVSKALAPFTNY